MVNRPGCIVRKSCVLSESGRNELSPETRYEFLSQLLFFLILYCALAGTD